MASRVLSSSVATKVLIGITGISLFLYLLVHIVGNLLVFRGPEFFNAYAHTMAGNPLIQVIEVGLVLVFLIHVVKTVRMVLANRAARPIAYARKERAGGRSRKTLASTTMILSGLWLLLFIVGHVYVFKFQPGYELADGSSDLYRLEMDNFANPLVVGFYVLSMLVVGSHLSHGISSATQSLGAHHSTLTPKILVAGKVIAALLAAGFILIALWAHFVGGVQA